jgi:hypothetical protein
MPIELRIEAQETSEVVVRLITPSRGGPEGLPRFEEERTMFRLLEVTVIAGAVLFALFLILLAFPNAPCAPTCWS